MPHSHLDSGGIHGYTGGTTATDPSEEIPDMTPSYPPAGGALDLRVEIERLGAREWPVRERAAAALRQAGGEAVEALVEGMAHPDWRVRRGCADLMDHLADDRCVE